MSPNLQMFAQDCSEEDLRAICEGLFVPQRHHGIDTHRAPCRDVASECGDSDESERCEKHRLDICGLHTKKQCGHEACYAHRASHTRNDALLDKGFVYLLAKSLDSEERQPTVGLLNHFTNGNSQSSWICAGTHFKIRRKK